MCAPVSEEQMKAWREARARKRGMAKIKDATLFGTANVAKLDVSFETRSYEQRFLAQVAARRQLQRA